jgi:hypothetical protein
MYRCQNENPKELVCHFSNIFYLKVLSQRGEWFKIVTGNGGTNNANTEDRTYYYEVFPSNNLELGLWMESKECYIRHQPNWC